jgi:hypothetical protein
LPIRSVFSEEESNERFHFSDISIPRNALCSCRLAAVPAEYGGAGAQSSISPLTIVAYIALVSAEYRYAGILKSAGATKWIAFVIAVFAASL